MRFVPITLLLLLFTSQLFAQSPINSPLMLKIEWVDSLEGDFSFKEEWSYPEGVYINRHGQVSCDGICPPNIDRMKDDEGRIIADSLEAFYTVVDTSHLFHSLKSKARTYEWVGTNFMNFQNLDNNRVKGNSAFGNHVHSILNIEIQENHCTAWIYFNSIRDLGIHNFLLKNGTIILEKKAFEAGIIKASFDFQFENTIDREQELSWSGLIYSQIKK